MVWRIIKFWYLIGYFFPLENNKEAIKNMYTVLFAIERVVLFKDVHGVAFHCDMDHCCNYTKRKRKTYDTEIMLLITGTRRLCREHTKLCILYFCSAVDIKGILKTKSAAGQQCFCFCVRFRSATSFRDHELPILFAVRAISNHRLLSTYSVPTAVIWDLSRSSNALCLHQNVELMLNCRQGHGERGRSASAGGQRGM